MGQCGHCAISRDNRRTKLWKHWKFTFEALHLKRTDFDRFFELFCGIDISGEGYVTIAQLLKYLRIVNNSYLEKVFALFANGKTGSLDFIQFVLAIWNYCTEHHSCLAAFSVRLILLSNNSNVNAVNAAGDVNKAALRSLFLDIYSSLKHSSSDKRYFENAMDRVFAVFPEFLTRADVTTVILFNPVLTLPATLLQRHVRDYFGGQKLWNRIVGMPVSMPDGTRLRLVDFKEKVNI